MPILLFIHLLLVGMDSVSSSYSFSEDVHLFFFSAGLLLVPGIPFVGENMPLLRKHFLILTVFVHRVGNGVAVVSDFNIFSITH